MRKLNYEEIFATRPTLEELNSRSRLPIFCLLENIRSLYNVGSIFRTSDAVRLSRLLLTGYTGYPPRREIDKTALGAVQSVPWQYVGNPLQAVKELKNQGIRLVALEHTSNSISCFEYDFQFPFCLLLGHEVSGLSEEIVASADAAIEIPMLGLKQSLNVAVAYGVVIYHAVFRYLQQNPAEKDQNTVTAVSTIQKKV